MHVITGASGTVGRAIVDQLLKNGAPVKGIVRKEQAATELQNKGAAYALAELHDKDALKAAVQGGTSLLAITPETGKEKDLLAETRDILQHYREAAIAAQVNKVVGISSYGAQHDTGTGNLLQSHMLERAFDGAPLRRIFIRPAYYFKNWALYLPVMQETGQLPSFFPPDTPLAMVAPEDVAALAARLLVEEQNEDAVYELQSAQTYTPQDVANAYSQVLGKQITVQHVPREGWADVLKGAGFSPNAIENFVDMTQAVLDGKTQASTEGVIPVTAQTDLLNYVKHTTANP
ncbi:NmrA family NAD(P)-binding protein [Chitinophaga horti]|uniref:NmrA family NAD(P)-binding protein n=1 Tax=Chitinophaga horti TaxID=2920382 RepID=A0ABY6J2G4_9BACT|nr:NmrA family NAD(P)-binding protein [Chitinophaga horti]UYQ93825.1 NmrA family NAD(P)-binding protein [Chitinophaga horti]